MEHQHSVWQHVAGVAEFIAAKARLETKKFALHYMSLGFLLQVFEKLDENQDGGISLEEGLAMYRTGGWDVGSVSMGSATQKL